MTAARTYTEAQHRAELKAAVEQAVAATKAKEREDRINAWIDNEERRAEDHKLLHANLDHSMTEMVGILRQAVVITDPKLLEAAPLLLESLQKERERGGERRQFWNGWKGRVAVTVSIGGFVMITLTSFGILPPRQMVPAPVVAPSPTPRHTP